MHLSLASLKPSAPRRAHLLLAASTWTIVGACLLAAGTTWVVRARLGPGPSIVVLAAAVGTGALKARFALRRAALRVTQRIESRTDDRCIGGFFSWRTWLVVGVMVVAGRALRASGVARPIVGFLYAAVGAALIIASNWPWRAWHTWPRRRG